MRKVAIAAGAVLALAAVTAMPRVVGNSVPTAEAQTPPPTAPGVPVTAGTVAAAGDLDRPAAVLGLPGGPTGGRQDRAQSVMGSHNWVSPSSSPADHAAELGPRKCRSPNYFCSLPPDREALAEADRGSMSQRITRRIALLRRFEGC